MALLSHRSVARSALRAAAMLGIAAAAVSGTLAQAEVRGFSPVEHELTPGERAAAAGVGRVGVPDAAFGLRTTPQAKSGVQGGLQVYGAFPGAADTAQSARTTQLLGSRALSDYDGFDRSSSSTYYDRPFQAFSPAWRDQSFARSVSRDESMGLPSVSAPRSFWGFRD